MLRPIFASIVVVLAVFGSSLAGPPATKATHVRKDVSTLSAEEIDALRKGVQAMKDRDAKVRPAGFYQANMHGTTDQPLQPAWAQCQHGSYFFLSWHRMYVYYFERILRKASGSADFAVPYWNYSSPNERALPLIFRDPADPQTNPLFVAERNQGTGNQDGINDGAELPAPATSFAAAFALTDFYSLPGSSKSFGGQKASMPQHFLRPHGKLEAQPHDIIHGLVGGDGWMGDPDFAARDPIFWLHHANIDRLWKRWLQQGGRQNPTDDNDWMTHKFDFFDEDGKAVQLSGQEILDTAGQLNYVYDDDPPPNVLALALKQKPAPREAPREPKMLYKTEEPTSLGADRTTVRVPLKQDTRAALMTAGNEKRSLILSVEGLQFEKNPGVYYEIYLNFPAGKKPDPNSINHIGNLGFFASPRHEQKHRKAAFDITEAVAALRQAKLWNEEEMNVTFVMRGLIPPKGRTAKHKEGPRAKFRALSLTAE